MEQHPQPLVFESCLWTGQQTTPESNSVVCTDLSATWSNVFEPRPLAELAAAAHQLTDLHSRTGSQIGMMAMLRSVSALVLVLTACVATTQEVDAARSVPLPLLLESLRSEVFDDLFLSTDSTHDDQRSSRGRRGAWTSSSPADTLNVPWYSRATRGEDDTAAREELKVTSVVKDEAFKYGIGVKKWHSLVVGTTTYMVGLGVSNITLVAAKFDSPDIGAGHTYSLSQSIASVGGTPLAAAVFKHWNSATKTLEAILVLSVEGEAALMWYRITDRGLETIRSWPVHKRITYLNVFQVGEQMKLLMLTSCESTLELAPCKASAAVYEFRVGDPLDAKLSQTLTLEQEAVSAEIGVVGDEVFLALALPEPGVVKLYRYNWPPLVEVGTGGNHSTHGWFEFWKDLHSPMVTHAVFFHVSYKMYLAVGGNKPAVFRFVSPTRIEGCPKALQKLGFVSTWLVLPVQTYRDEVVLLAEVEEIVEGNPFKGVVTLTWGSVGIFNWQYQPPCYVGGKQSTVPGVSCIIAESGERGLSGAVAVQLGDASVVTVLVPQRVQPSSFYRIFTELQPVVNPLLAEIEMLKLAQSKLNDEIFSQNLEMEKTENLLQDALNAGSSNVIKADWTIEEVFTPEYERGMDFSPPTIEPGNQAVDLSELEVLVHNLRNLTQEVLGTLKDAAVPMNGEIHLHGDQTLLGGLEVVRNASFYSLSVSFMNGEPVPLLLKDAVRVNRVDKIGGTKTLLHLKAQDIDFTLINNVPKDDLIFNVPGQSVRVDGNLEIDQVLQVDGNVDLPPSGTIGGIDFSEEIFVSGREFKGMVQFDEVTVEGNLTVNVINAVAMNPHSLRSIVSGKGTLEDSSKTYDTLDVGGQLRVEKINGFLWSDIVKRIVWTDEPEDINGVTTIDGVVESASMEMVQLNGLSFPHDFVLKNATNQHITGNKVIQNQLLVGVVDVFNTVDGVPVNSFVTLRTDQYLDGELKLTEADINGDLKVDWAVNGMKLNQMNTKSPLINENAVVSSNVVFSNLEVLGPIQIANTLDQRIFKDIQDILVLPPSASGTVLISGKKTVQGNLNVSSIGINVISGLVNGQKVVDIARIDAAQKFGGDRLIQKAVFDDIQLTGHWDGVDVVALNADAVRVNGIQDTQTRLKFTEPSKLFASRLLISDQLNTVVANPALGTASDDVCDTTNQGIECTIRGSVSADVFRVTGNVVVDGKVCGWGLVDFERRRMSRSRPQGVQGDFSFGNIDIAGFINVTSLNSIPISTLGQSDISSVQKLQKLNAGGFAVDELYIDGNIHTRQGVNYLNLSKISENAVKLSSSNIFVGPIVFEDVLNVKSLNVRGPISKLNLAYIVQDTVLKNELHSVTLSGKKTFDAGFVVNGNIQTSKLNGLDPSKILTRNSTASVAGPLRVLGSVYAGNINLNGLLNGIPVSSFQNRYQLLSEGRHVLKGSSMFGRGVSVDDLFVMQSVNGTKLEDFFNSVVMKNEQAKITGLKYFFNKIVFEEVTVRGLVNSLPLSEIAQDVVLHNDDSPVTVNGRITFGKILTTRVGVSLSGNLDAAELDGCLIKEWVDNAIYLSEPLQIFGVKKFSSMTSHSDLKLSMLNAVDLSKVITLNTQQDIPRDVNILAAVLRHNLPVNGSVNGVFLLPEYLNTLMTTGDQIVTGSKTFVNGLTVRNNVLIKGRISGRDITNVVTLQGDQTISGPLKFSNMVVNGDLRAGLISSFDVQKWQDNAFFKNSPLLQSVTGAWNVEGQVKFIESVGGKGLLDGEDVLNLSALVYKRRELNRKTQEEIKIDWIRLCHDTDALLEKARAQPFLFQQVEVVQAIQAALPIASMHAFEALGEQFLAISYTDNCTGAMYRWNGRITTWELLDGAVQNIGSVERWATLRNAGSTYLFTSQVNGNSCPYNGGNIWRFEPSASSLKLRNMHTMDPWHDSQLDEASNRMHLLRRSSVETWYLEEGGVEKLPVVSLPVTDQAQFVPRSAGHGLAFSDGESLTLLENSGDNNTLGAVSRSANSNLPARSKGNVVTMKIADGRKLVAVSAQSSDLLVVYEDVASGHSLASVQVHGAHSLSVMELTASNRSGQTLLAFIENERFLRVVQYKGVEGFVDVAKARLALSVKEMVPVRLRARNFVNLRHFLLLRSNSQVLSLEVEMTGDPLDEPSLNCYLP